MRNCSPLRYLFPVSALLIVGLYLNYAGQLALVRHAAAIKTFFQPEEKVRIAARRDELPRGHFLLTEQEFDWRGQRIDVLERRVSGDSVVIIGYIDEAEMALKKVAPWLFEESGSAAPPPYRPKKQHPAPDLWVISSPFRFSPLCAFLP